MQIQFIITDYLLIHVISAYHVLLTGGTKIRSEIKQDVEILPLTSSAVSQPGQHCETQ